MSTSQLKKLILIIVGIVVVVGGLFALLFFYDGTGSSNDIEDIKAKGGYETMKMDLVSTLRMRDSQAATIANIFFEEIGVENYESMEVGGLKGNTFIYCDGFKFDAFIRAGEIANAYIGNAVVYKNAKVTSTIVSTATEYTYRQYITLVNGFTKSLKVDKDVGKNLYESLTLMGIGSFTNVKSGKLNDVKGYYGYEGTLQYFLTLNTDNTIHNIYVVCDGFEPLEIYNSATGKGQYSLSNIKVTYGNRQNIANSLAYKVKSATELEVVFPAALLNGDDSWLMVQNGDEIYIEVSGEIKDGDKTKVKDFVIKMTDSNRDLTYLNIDKKVYIGAE